MRLCACVVRQFFRPPPYLNVAMFLALFLAGASEAEMSSHGPGSRLHFNLARATYKVPIEPRGISDKEQPKSTHEQLAGGVGGERASKVHLVALWSARDLGIRVPA